MSPESEFQDYRYEAYSLCIMIKLFLLLFFIFLHVLRNKLGCRIFAATWNVGGKTPNNGLNLEDFLKVEGSSDIYVLGYDAPNFLLWCVQ